MEDVVARLRAALADRYTIERELGHGGMATVYLASDLKHQRGVALKVLRPDLAAVLGADRFLREIRIAAQLNHPHVLPLFDSGDAGGLLYYVMPYIEGESLRDRLAREKQLSVEDALAITRHVAAALAYAHRAGILHRDIKPENILLSGGEAVVADFGIARAIAVAGSDRLTETGIAVGTPPYMSPEQASGVSHALDQRSDLYSLGCVLYEMLAGKPPFTGPTAESVLHQHLSLPAPPVRALRPNVPVAVERALERALAKTPADRFATAAELAAALDLSDARASGDRIRLRGRWVAVAGVAGVAAVGGAYALLSHTPSISGSVAPMNSVAVLYFDNLSRDTGDAYLADGLTEEITARLGRIERLAVKSRNAMQRYRGHATDDPESLGRALRVSYLVSGSVRRSGGRVRVGVELTRAATGLRKWGDEYERADTDLFAIEEAVGSAVTAQIAGQLLPAERRTFAARPTRNPAAYDHVLRGNFYLARRSPQDALQAIREYEAAAHDDTTYAQAHARVAYTYALFLDWGWTYPGAPAESVQARGFAGAERALRIDSALSDPWMARGYLLAHQHPRTLEGAREAFEHAITLDSTNAEAWHQYGWIRAIGGDDSGAVAAFRRALTVDPGRAVTLMHLGAVRFAQGRFTEAARWLDSAVVVDPSFYYGYVVRGLLRARSGDRPGALADAQAAVRLEGEDTVSAEAVLAIAQARLGDTLAARARAERLAANLSAPHMGVDVGGPVAAALVAVGDDASALSVLERVRPRGAHLWFDCRYLDFAPLRRNPRFQRLMEESRPLSSATAGR